MATVNDTVPSRSHTPDSGSPELDSRKRKASYDRNDGESPKRQRQIDSAPTHDRSRRFSSPRERKESVDSLKRDDAATHRSATLEEKKRGRRLFGGLLNTLSQTNKSTQQRRQQEIERRQQERVQKQRAEDDQKNEEKLAQLREIRLARQIEFDEKVMENRHHKLLWKARHLTTTAEPSIYYTPWKLTEAQENIIDEQVREAKDTIEKEKAAFEQRKHRHEEVYGPRPSSSGGQQAEQPHKNASLARDSSPKENVTEHDEVKPETTSKDGHDQTERRSEESKAANCPHDDYEDIVVEADEDTVIY